MAVGSYDPIASNNTTINGVALGENVMTPSDVNNAIRELMADLAILTGTEVANVPAGSIIATDVQAAIDELDTEKIASTRILTAGDGLSGGGDLSADRTFDLDLATLPAGTVAIADEIAMADVDDSNNVKKITAQSIANLDRTVNLTIDNTSPALILDESDGTTTHSQTRFIQSSDIFSIATRTSAGALVNVDYEISKDAAGASQHTWKIGANNQMRLDSSGRLITGNVTADPLPALAGGVLISVGDSGVTDANNSADDLIVERNGVAGLSILTPNTAQANIYFGDPEDNNAGRIVYDHPNNELELWTSGLLGAVLNRLDAGDAGADGVMSIGRIRLNATNDASATSTAHAFQVGSTSSLNIVMDNNEIMSRDNGVVSQLILNNDGGDVLIDGDSAVREVSSSIVNDGFMKLKWGGTGGHTVRDVLIQWGQVSIGSSGTTVTWPTAFSANPYGFASISLDTGGGQSGVRVSSYSSLTSTNVFIRNWLPSGDPSLQSGTVRYVVIGPTT